MEKNFENIFLPGFIITLFVFFIIAVGVAIGFVDMLIWIVFLIVLVVIFVIMVTVFGYAYNKVMSFFKSL
ncbi:hypothetical protein A0U40_18385 [[Bacillus] sp. KCTC 13219]|nr:hypothetical protein A0U40_18385 [[Bacillus] sp. KCTC 13219]